MSVKASAAELLLVLLPLLATASEEGVYPRPLATAAIQRQASSGSCPAVDSPRFWGHHVGVVEVGIVDCFGKLIPGPETCLRELIPGAETSYEVEFFYGSHTSIDGPKKRRARAAEGAPKLFSGLYFCLSAYMNSEDREHIQNLIAAAEGQVLEGSSLHSLHENLEKNPVKLYFVYNCGPPRKFTANFSLDLRKEIEEGIEYAASGAQAIGHLMVFNAIASF